MGFLNKRGKESEQLGIETKEAEHSEEVQGEMANQGKKKYKYIAVDRQGNVLLSKNNEPYFRNVEEGSAVDWPPEIKNIAICDPNLRVDFGEIPEHLKGNDREKAKREARESAEKKLRELAADKIRDAIAERERKGRDGAEGASGQECKAGEGGTVDKNDTDNAMTVKCGSSLMAEKKREEGKGSNERPTEGDEAAQTDVSIIVKTIENVEENLNRDYNDLTEAVLDTIKNTGDEIVAQLKKNAKSENLILGDKVKRSAEDITRNVEDRTKESAEKVIGIINEESKALKEKFAPIASATDKNAGDIREMKESIEGIEGKLHEQLDSIVGILQNKGLVMSMDIPPVNAEEEDIINLVRYSQKITEQLGYAARDLVRKQAAFRSQAQSNANEQNMIEQKITEAHADGVREGQRRFIGRLISKYADIDTLKDSDEGYIHSIWALLCELGVEIDADGKYAKGKEIIVSDEESHKMMGIYTGIDGAGKYRVVRTGLVYSGEIIYKAEFEKTETPQGGAAEKIVEETQVQSE